MDVLIPPGIHAHLWAKPAEGGCGAWQELGAGEECSFWLKIMPGEVWILPEPVFPVPLGGRVTLPGHQPCLELLSVARRQEQGRKPPAAQINYPAGFSLPRSPD